jgi:hypothetical protein
VISDIARQAAPSLPPLAEGVPATEEPGRVVRSHQRSLHMPWTRLISQPEGISPSYLHPPSGGCRNLPPASGRTILDQSPWSHLHDETRTTVTRGLAGRQPKKALTT